MTNLGLESYDLVVRGSTTDKGESGRWNIETAGKQPKNFLIGFPFFWNSNNFDSIFSGTDFFNRVFFGSGENFYAEIRNHLKHNSGQKEKVPSRSI